MSKIEVDAVEPQSGTALTIGASGDTITVPSGATLTTTNATVNLPATTTVTTELKTNKISPASGTAFTLGDSGDTFTIPAGATITNSGTATGFGGGITEADNWRLNANLSGDHEPIASATFERCDNTGYSKIGTGMSYDSSSGLFTFGATGLYYVVWNWGVQLDSSADGSMITYIQGNISGSVVNLAQGKLSGDTSDNQHQMLTISALYNVTNVSTHKIQINVNSMNNNDTRGDTGYTISGISFIRLADSQ